MDSFSTSTFKRKEKLNISNNYHNKLIIFCLFSFIECDSQCSDEASPIEMPPQLLTIGTLVPIQKPSPERRITQKEIIAGEERPKFLTIKQIQESGMDKFLLIVTILKLNLKHQEYSKFSSMTYKENLKIKSLSKAYKQFRSKHTFVVK